MPLPKTNVTCTESGVTVNADILAMTARYLKVVIELTESTVDMHKNAPSDAVFVGNSFGLEFTSTGEEL